MMPAPAEGDKREGLLWATRAMSMDEVGDR